MAGYWTDDWSDRFWEHGSHPKSVCILHTTENDASTPATNVAQYQINTQSGSYHALVDDAGRIVRCNSDDQVTWSCGNRGNEVGLNLSFVARAAWSRAQWLSHDRLLRGGARVVRFWCDTHQIPTVAITPAQLGAGVRGISDHNGARIAWGVTDHTDVGPHFPWDVFMAYVRGDSGAGGKPAPEPQPKPKPEEATMEDSLILDQMVGPERNPDGSRKFTGWPQTKGKTFVDYQVAANEELKHDFTRVTEQIANLAEQVRKLTEQLAKTAQ